MYILGSRTLSILTLSMLALSPLSACTDACPTGSARRADGLCYLTDSSTGSGSTGSTGSSTLPPGDTGEEGYTWGLLPTGCDASSSFDDPLAEVGRYFYQDDLFAEGTDIELDGDVAWLAGQGGVWSIDISDPANPRYLGKATSGGDRWYNVHPGPDSALYVTSRDLGFAVFDRTDPSSPTLLRQDAGQGPAGMASTDTYLYVASLQGSLLTYDINAPLSPVLVNEVTGLANAWAVQLLGDRAYVADNSQGLLVFDLSDPAAPALLTTVATASGAQDLALAPDGSALYVATGGTGVQTFSLTDPDAPVAVGTVDLSQAIIGVAVGGDNLWAVSQQDLVAFDISSPAAPVLINSQQTEQWAMAVAADDDRAWVADWGYIASYQRTPGVTAPDADLSSTQVFLPGEGGGNTLSLTNLGSDILTLLGATPSDERITIQAEALTVDPGDSIGIRLSWEGGEDLDTTVCFATDDPDEATMEVAVTSNQDGNPALGADAIDFSLTGLDGQTYTLSEQTGRPVFIAYFATW